MKLTMLEKVSLPSNPPPPPSPPTPYLESFLVAYTRLKLAELHQVTCTRSGVTIAQHV